MLLLRPKRFFLLIGMLGLIGCAGFGPNRDFEKATYFEASFNDKNRAPASMTPPANAGSESIDPVYMQTQADYYFSMGESYSLDGNHQKAIESFKMVLVYDQKSAQVPLRIAAEYVKLGMLSQALEFAQTAVSKNSKYVEARLLLGGLYSSFKSYDKAIEEYLAVLKIDPKNTDAPMYIGAVYAEQKHYEKAVKYFESLTSNEDYNTPHMAYYYIGRIRVEQGGKQYLKSAEQAFLKAIKLKNDYAEAVIALANLYNKMNMEKKALEFLRNYQKEYGPSLKVAELLAQKYLEDEQYDQAFDQLEIIEANSEDALNVKVKMALILIEKKKYEPAAVKLREILKLAPDSDKIRFYLAAVYEEMGLSSDAVENFAKVGADSQYYGESVVHAAYLLKQQKRLDQAIGMVKAGLKQRKDLPQMYAIYASLLDEKGEYKTALESLNEGVEKHPEHVQLQFFLGTIHDRLGDKKSVITHMKKVLALDPNHVQGLNYLAFTYTELDTNLEEAEGLVKRALKLDPHDGYILDTYGWVLFKQGRYPESVRILESAYKAQPTESIIAEHLGDAYFKSQMIDRARSMYQKAAESENDEMKLKGIRSKLTAIQNQEPPAAMKRSPASTSNPGTTETLKGD